MAFYCYLETSFKRTVRANVCKTRRDMLLAVGSFLYDIAKNYPNVSIPIVTVREILKEMQDANVYWCLDVEYHFQDVITEITEHSVLSWGYQILPRILGGSDTSLTFTILRNVEKETHPNILAREVWWVVDKQMMNRQSVFYYDMDDYVISGPYKYYEDAMLEARELDYRLGKVG